MQKKKVGFKSLWVYDFDLNILTYPYLFTSSSESDRAPMCRTIDEIGYDLSKLKFWSRQGASSNKCRRRVWYE